MITGAHFLLYSHDPEADRRFFREVLDFPSVDVGHGWLIFGLPAAEMAVHPVEGSAPAQNHAGHGLLGAVLYLMCDDLPSVVRRLGEKNVQCTKTEEAPWGIKTTVRLPSGGEVGLYQPLHPAALGLAG